LRPLAILHVRLRRRRDCCVIGAPMRGGDFNGTLRYGRGPSF
jgi:hypothetical protein